MVETSKAEHSTVNNLKGFVLVFFIPKSSKNSLKFVCLSLSLAMYRMLGVGYLSWNIATL